MPWLAVRLALIALIAAPAAAQTTDAPPRFRTGVDLVRFDVRVTDDKGRPVTDLRPEELTIFDGDRALPILMFQRVTEPAGAYVDAAMRAMTAEVSSNEAFPRGHLYILIFDQHHITPGNEHRARQAAEQFIKNRVRPSDRVAIYGIPGPGPQLNFTADRQRAVSELEKVRGAFQRVVATPLAMMPLHEAYEIARGSERALTEALTRVSSEQLGDLGPGLTAGGAARAGRAAEDPSINRRVMIENARSVVAQADGESRQFLMRTADLIRQYRAIEGRKIVALFSEGFHQDNVGRDLEVVAAAAAQSYCVFYSMDLNLRGPDLTQETPQATDASIEIHNRIEALGSLAVETDGILVKNAIDHLGTAFDRLANDAQDYYLVGFAPPADAQRGQETYRRVRVSVSRPGARVSARSGYAIGRSSPLDRRRAIDTALAAPFAQQGLRVDYTTYMVRSDKTPGAKVFLSLAAEIPPGVRDEARADVVFVVRDMHDGRVVASSTDTVALAAKPDQPGGTARYRVHFEVPPGTYLMRTVVREPGGLLGSADRRLEVRTLSGPDVALSDVILSSPGDTLPVRARAYVEDGLTAFIEVYGRAAEQLQDVAVDVDLVPLGSDTAAARGTVVIDKILPVATSAMRRAQFAFDLQQVEPGEYLVRARVRAGSESAGEVLRQVEVLRKTRQ